MTPDVRITDEAGNPIDFVIAQNVPGLLGTLLVTAACEWLREGRAYGAKYHVSIDPGSINTGVTPKTATVVVDPDHASHPLARGVHTFTGVKLDGTTVYKTHIPDVAVVYADYATGVVDTWSSDVSTGFHLGAYEDGGATIYEERLGVKNFGTTLAEEVTLTVSRPAGVLYAKAGTGLFAEFLVETADPEEREDPGTLKTRPYKFAAANLDAGANRIDLLWKFDDVMAFSLISLVRRLSNNTVSTSAQIFRNEWYRFESPLLEGCKFRLRADAGNADTANETIWRPGYGRLISADDGGTAVAFEDLDVEVGDLLPAAMENWHLQVTPLVGSGQKNPVQVPVGLRYLDTGYAGVDEA